MKSLIIYFSWADENYAVGYVDKGNTEIVAEYIKELTGSDIFKVEPAIPYAKDYDTCIKEAQERINTHNAPILSKITSISEYDTIYIGAPIYWSYMPEELVTAIKDLDWNGKNIKLFTTHEGSGLGSIPEQIKEVCKGATLLDTIAIQGSQAKNSKNKLEEWLKN